MLKKEKIAGKFTIFEKRDPINLEVDANRYAGVKCTENTTFKSSGRKIYKRGSKSFPSMSST
jgi:hypothetical protein